MRVDVITLFPQVFPGPLGVGVVGRAIEAGLVQVHAHDLREHGRGAHRQVDDLPFGGGPGMVLRPEPLFAALRAVAEIAPGTPGRGVLLAAHGCPLDARLARELAREQRLVLVCGRYEGVDERVRQAFQLDEVSVGDFVVSGGELPAMLLIEAVCRHLPGVLGDPQSAEDESFSQGLPEYPHYTRPAEFEGLTVPEVLRSGDHRQIEEWRREAALERARRLRPDLLGAGVHQMTKSRVPAGARVGGA